MPVYLVTFSIEPIARAYGTVRDSSGRRIFSGWRGTPLEREETGAISGCLFSNESLSPGAKVKISEDIRAAGNHDYPLIIGHGEDEAAMAAAARRAGGGSIGFLRRKSDLQKIKSDFDLVLRGDYWKTILKELEK